MAPPALGRRFSRYRGDWGEEKDPCYQHDDAAHETEPVEDTEGTELPKENPSAERSNKAAIVGVSLICAGHKRQVNFNSPYDCEDDEVHLQAWYDEHRVVKPHCLLHAV